MSKINVQFTTHHEIGNWSNVSHCCSLCRADLNINNHLEGHKDNCTYHDIFEIQEENQELHQEVSRLIDEVCKRDLTIQQLGNQIMQMQGEIERLKQRSIELSMQDSSFDEIQDLRDLVNDICMMVFQYNYHEDKGYYLSILNQVNGDDDMDGHHVFFLEKINKVMGYEVKDNG